MLTTQQSDLSHREAVYDNVPESQGKTCLLTTTMNGRFLQEGAGFWLEGRASMVCESALVLNNLAIDAG